MDTNKSDTPTATDKLKRPLRDLRISVIDRCNLRCTYCMPSEVFGPDYAFLPRKDWLSFDQIEQLARAFVDIGVRKLRLTGGEPLLRPDLPELVSRLSTIPKVEDFAITTNGRRLAPVAEELKQAGIGRVTISLDALAPEICGRMNGLGFGPEKVLEGIDAAIACGLSPKINMVVQRGVNEGEILPMARYFHNLRVPIRFIEYMDVGNGQRWNRSQVVPSAEILTQLREEFSLEPLAPRSAGEVARRYGIPGGYWEVGFVSSITAPFCRSCNRARISADGKLFTCLFATNGTDLKPVINESDSAQSLTARLARFWESRNDRYSEERGSAVSTTESKDQVAMSFIGG
ncbi:MAG: cyclic pyranopterin phosphate synthase [Verrucomicrobiales bacterium]|jgi:cyclic pyranopterin phosphate synthase